MRLAELEGLIPTEVGEALTRFARASEGDIVEVGSYKGKSTCYLAAGAEGRTVWAVDAWGLAGNEPGRFRFDLAFDTFQRQVSLMGFTDIVRPVNGFSLDVAETWEAPIGLLYVDGDHHYKPVLADLEAWSPHCEGLIVCDDWGTPRNPGVAQAVDEFCRTYDVGYRIEAGRLAVIEWG